MAVRGLLYDDVTGLWTAAIGGLVTDNANGAAAAANSSPVVLSNETVRDYHLIGGASRSALNDNLAVASGSGALDVMNIGGGYGSFRSFTAQIVGSVGISAGAITFEASNDNVNWVNIPVQQQAVASVIQTGALAVAASSSLYFHGRIAFRYFRCRISTAFTGGTVQGFFRFSLLDEISGTLTVGQAAAGSLAATVSQTSPANLQAQVSPLPTGVIGTTVALAASTNAGVLKAGAGNLYAMTISNMSASVIWVKLYNTSSAPTVGTTVPVDVIPVPANAFASYEFGGWGHRFATGIAYAVTGAQADSDTTAIAAGSKLHMSYA